LFAVFAYFANAAQVIVPVVLLSVDSLFFGIMSWRRLRRLEDLRPAALHRTQLRFVRQAEEETQAKNAQRYEAERSFFQTVPRPRAAQFKASARIFSIAFPAWRIIFGHWAYQITRHAFTVKKWSDDIPPFLFRAVIWSFIRISTILGAREDRHLLANGDVAIATITSQELSGGKHKSSKVPINSGTTQGEYDPENADENVLLVTASCELKRA
jgi:hypothetical protein